MTGTPNRECQHTVTQGREGHCSGKSWCIACGALAFDVETQPCADCRHSQTLASGSICNHHLMAITPSMKACFSISEGTCFTARTD
jgi:hypothetical protein